jgi:hypothetical protein
VRENPKTGPLIKLLWWPSQGGVRAGKRKVHTAAFQAQVPRAALKGHRTVNQLAGHSGVHPRLQPRREKATADRSKGRLRKSEPAGQTPENLRLRRRSDQQSIACPGSGSRRRTPWLTQQAEEGTRKRVPRLSRLMGREAIDPKLRLSRAGKEHQVYPCLLVQRLWRSVKSEALCLRGSEPVLERSRGLGRYFASRPMSGFISRWTIGPQRRSIGGSGPRRPDAE